MIKNIRHYSLLIVCFLFLGQTSFARERISINEGWRFKKDDPSGIGETLKYENIKQWILPSGNKYLQSSNKHVLPAEKLSGGEYTQNTFDDSAWRSLDLPHDWGVEGPFIQEYPGETAKLPWMGMAWYRKQINIDAADAGKMFFLEVDGAMSFSTVWCNGELVGGWPYGYASYQLDLTPYLKAGQKNTIAIRLDNPDESSRWYPGGGIYRNVWLTKTEPVHISQWGTFVTTPEISKEKASINVEVKVSNPKQVKGKFELQTAIFTQDKKGKAVGVAVAETSMNVNSLNIENTFNQNIDISNPKLWDVDAPNMYVAVTSVVQDGKIVDSYNTPFGIRTSKFTTDDGYYLNGRRVRLQGVCMHHDHGALGAAFNYRAMERQIEILQEMGVNAIRTSHNPPAPEMLELCDRMGILVLDEFVDTWIQPKKPNGYALIFNDWHEQDLRAFMHRDRNHPSVIAWSTGNEVGEQHNKAGIIISKWLTEIVHQEDATRPSTIGNDNPAAGSNGFETSADVFGYNYKPHLYAKFSKERPNIPFYGSETASCISTRGEYLFPVDDDKSGGKIGFFMSSYDLYAPGWASPPDTEFKGQDEAPADAGEFVWTGFDYLGEPTPFMGDMTVLTNYHDPVEKAAAEKALKEMGKITVPSRSSYFGIVDLAGFKKDRFYIYQARWRNDLPMAHILPHWNWEDRVGEVTPIHVYTSGDSAELFLNGKSLGKKTIGKFEYRLRWDDVVYEPGEVKVVAYKNDKVWAENVVKTTGKASRIKLEADRVEATADGYDLIYVTAKIEDKDSLTVPRAMNLVNFSITGAAEIVATDNGDQTSHELFQNKHIKSFNGMCLAILRTKKGQAGNIQLKATSKGLKAASINLKAVK